MALLVRNIDRIEVLILILVHIREELVVGSLAFFRSESAFVLPLAVLSTALGVLSVIAGQACLTCIPCSLRLTFLPRRFGLAHNLVQGPHQVVEVIIDVLKLLDHVLPSNLFLAEHDDGLTGRRLEVTCLRVGVMLCLG